MQYEDIKALVQEDFQAMDATLISSLNSKVSNINDLILYIFQGGGKRLRPLVLLLIARACGYQGQTHITLGAVVEIIHTATLLHDDVVDQAELRRGHKAANQIWGNKTAILAGDFLYSTAFRVLATTVDPTILEVLVNASHAMAEGEAAQLLNRGNLAISEATYLEGIRAKTGKLFEAAAELGARLSNIDPHHYPVLCRYGMHLGAAFQMIDDLLDYCGQDTQTGKQLGNDLGEGKITLPLIFILQQGKSETRAELRRLLETHQTNTALIFDEIKRLIEISGAIPYTVQAAKQQAQAAQAALQALPESPFRRGAEALATFAVERSY